MKAILLGFAVGGMAVLGVELLVLGPELVAARLWHAVGGGILCALAALAASALWRARGPGPPG